MVVRCILADQLVAFLHKVVVLVRQVEEAWYTLVSEFLVMALVQVVVKKVFFLVK